MDREYIESLWVRAVSHCGCAQELASLALAEAIENCFPDADQVVFNGRHSASIHLLIGFSLELMLKVAFLLEGGDAARLRAIGHDLRKALQHAEGLGFEPLPPKTAWVVDNLHETHLNHHFRYGDEPTIQMPALEDTFSVLNGLYEQLGKRVWGPIP